MLLHSIRHMGSVPFAKKEIVLDFDKLEGIIAVTGKNESGKTTLFDLIPGSIWLTMPFRPGPLYKNWAVSGFTELIWSDRPDGTKYQSYIKVDTKSERVEANLRVVGGPHKAGPLARDYKADADKRLGPLELFLCTAYAKQPSQSRREDKLVSSFLKADRSERKAILTELLGLKRFVVWHTFVKGQISEVEKKIEKLKTRIEELEGRLGGREELEEALEKKRTQLTATNQLISLSESTVSKLKDRLAEISAQRRELKQVYETVKSIIKEIAELRKRQDDIVKRLANNENLLADAVSIKAAYERTVQIDQAISVLDALVSESNRIQTEIETIVSNKTVLTKRHADAVSLASQESSIQAAKVQEKTFVEEVARLQAAVDDVTAAMTLKERIINLEKEIERKTRQAGLMTEVPCGGEGNFAGCQFLKDASQAKSDVPELKGQLSDLKKPGDPDLILARFFTGSIDGLKDLKEKLRKANHDLANVRQTLGFQSEISAAKARVDEISAQLIKADTDKDRLRAVYLEIRDRLEGKKVLEDEKRSLKDKASLFEHLSAAKARIESYKENIMQLELDITNKSSEGDILSKKLAKLPELDQDYESCTRKINEETSLIPKYKESSASLEREIGSIETQISILGEVEKELEETKDLMMPHQKDLTDWAILSKAMSPSGIPALLIDKSLPEIGSLATDLLRKCYGSEIWSIKLVTQKQSADESKLLETLDVLVTRKGDPIDTDLLSGGAGVLVSEALALGIALVNSDRSGRKTYFLLRDEVSAPLDIDNAPAYVKMLRRAAEIGGFKHVLFVTHQPACWQLADARIEVSNGAINIL